MRETGLIPTNITEYFYLTHGIVQNPLLGQLYSLSLILVGITLISKDAQGIMQICDVFF